jgi:hypothetical protein
MAPVTIPEGHVFFPKLPGVAAGLLAAADAIGADRKADVRTITGGYHVTEAVAEQYRSTLPPEPEDPQGEPTGDPGEPTGDPGDDGKAEELGPLPVTAESSNAEIDDYAGKQEPPVDLSSAKNRVEKIALLEAARTPATDTKTEE